MGLWAAVERSAEKAPVNSGGANFVVCTTGDLSFCRKLAAAIGCTVVAIVFLWRSAQWQNSIRELMQLEPVDSAYPLEVGLIALAVFAILMAFARLFRLTFRFVAIRVNRLLPRRISNVIGGVVAVTLFWSVISGVLFRVSLPVADSSFQAYDALVEPKTKQPTDPLKTGSSASLLAWRARCMNLGTAITRVRWQPNPDAHRIFATASGGYS
jgi:uncharacterized membrane protein